MQVTSKIDGAASEVEHYTQRGFGKTIGFGEKPAVIVIDFMRAFTDPEMALGAELGAEIDATNRITERARAAGVTIFFAFVSYDEPDFRDAGLWRFKQKGLETLRTGTPGVTLDPRVDYRTDDPLVRKKFASCFFGTSLAARLQSDRIDTVILTGCTTSGCVRATAVDACQHGFRPIVAREAVGDRSRPAHEQSLIDLHFKYADVMATDEVLEAL